MISIKNGEREMGGAVPSSRIALILMFLAVACTGCGIDGEYNIRLSASGTAKDVLITYQDQEGDHTIASTALPWSTEFVFKPRHDDFGDNRCVTVKNNNDDAETVTAAAYTDGELDESNKCSGSFCQVKACSRYVYADSDHAY